MTSSIYYVLMWETGEVQRPHPGLVDENGVAPVRTVVSAATDYRIRIFLFS